MEGFFFTGFHGVHGVGMRRKAHRDIDISRHCMVLLFVLMAAIAMVTVIVVVVDVVVVVVVVVDDVVVDVDVAVETERHYDEGLCCAFVFFFSR